MDLINNYVKNTSVLSGFKVVGVFVAVSEWFLI